MRLANILLLCAVVTVITMNFRYILKSRDEQLSGRLLSGSESPRQAVPRRKMPGRCQYPDYVANAGATKHTSYEFVTTNITQDSIIYGVGAGKSILFEEEFVTKYGVNNVYVFDPTPRSVKIMTERVALPLFAGRIRFTAEALSTKSGTGEMLFPDSSSLFISGTSVDQFNKTKFVEKVTVKFGTLDEWMAERGHHWLDILKLDIEGAEYGVLESILSKGPPPFNQLVIEWHSRLTTEARIQNDLIEKLKEYGYVEVVSPLNRKCKRGQHDSAAYVHQRLLDEAERLA
eukprot:Selendium_serpulae@DN6406_c0_g1_i6.p1